MGLQSTCSSPSLRPTFTCREVGGAWGAEKNRSTCMLIIFGILPYTSRIVLEMWGYLYDVISDSATVILTK